MGYFSNGDEGRMYEAQYCHTCRHHKPETMCAVWHAHALYNYSECNNDDSILHILIPRDEHGWNLECGMYLPQPEQDRETLSWMSESD